MSPAAVEGYGPWQRANFHYAGSSEMIVRSWKRSGRNRAESDIPAGTSGEYPTADAPAHLSECRGVAMGPINVNKKSVAKIEFADTVLTRKDPAVTGPCKSLISGCRGRI